VNVAQDRGAAVREIVLHAQSGKKGQHHIGDGCRVHARSLGLDILYKKMFEV
jgi:hypothetical protein